MGENRIINFFRVLFFLDKSKTDEEQEMNLDVLSNGNGVGDDTEIHVNDEVPDFLKPQDEEYVRNDSDSLREEAPVENVLQKDDFLISVGGRENDLGTEVGNPNNNVEKSKKKVDNPTDVELDESLLDNKPLVKMFEECADVIKNVERIRPAFESEETQDLINTIREQLVQAMVLSGGKTIDNEKQFDILRHKCEKGIHANDGDEIEETLEPGVSLENRVLVKALVKIRNIKER